MSAIEETLLHDLKKIIPSSAHGANNTMFTIALEGWRRGLNLKFFTKHIKGRMKIRFALSDQDKEIDFQLSLAEIVPKYTRNTTRSKEQTKKILLESNVPTPNGGSFGVENSDEEIIQFSKSLTYPLVIKPMNSSLGRGVFTGIKDEKMLSDYLFELRKKMNYSDIIVEQEVTGEDTRLYVVGDQVVGGFKRIAANVTGDGEKSIKQLIFEKNKNRKKNPHIGGSQIPIDNHMNEFLKRKGLTIDSIPKKDEYVVLSESTIATKGADTEDVTEKLSEKSKEIAVKAAKTLPGLSVCGVDIMIDSEKGTNFVLELNSRPNIGGSVFPVIGKPQNIPKAIIDYYFPNSMQNKVDKKRAQFYFDFNAIDSILRTGTVKEVSVPPVPVKDVVAKKMIVRGNVTGVGFRKWVTNTATGYNLYGNVKNIKNGQVRIIIAGKSNKVEEFIEKVKNKQTKKIKVESVRVKDWYNPVKVGFEVKDNTSKEENLKEEMKIEKKENDNLIKLNSELRKKLDNIENSKSWKYTMPARKILRTFKRN